VTDQRTPPGAGATVFVTPRGPYRVVGTVTVHGVDGAVLETSGDTWLCRCGGSRNKPLCDATHGAKAFDGAEAAGHDRTEDRREAHHADGITVYDDRTRCAHFGQCTDRLAAVFRADAEPFVDAGAAAPDQITDVVAGCPSGALAYAAGDEQAPIEAVVPASITPLADGPYRLQGDVQVVDAHGQPYERRVRQTLCRCGHSRNKPFCDGSHWYAEFRDPLRPGQAQPEPTLYDWVGGLESLERLTSTFYGTVLSRPDPVLEPVFRGMHPGHPKHVAAWLAETFGGPASYSYEHGGYEHMLAKHRNLGLTEQQRQRWVALMLETADVVGLPDDPGFRSTFVAYLEWGTRLAVANSQNDADVMTHAPIPVWSWGQTPPYTPQPWDHPDAADAGRRRYAEHARKPPPPEGEHR
jgi:CDGSH-type Zn-finger protein/truncated hemoglobin YjbI